MIMCKEADEAKEIVEVSKVSKGELARRSRADQLLEDEKRGLLNAEYVTWAEEKVRGYVKYKMLGKAHRLKLGKDVVSHLANVSKSGEGAPAAGYVVGDQFRFEGDLDHHDYLQVLEWMQEFTQERPEFALIDELLSHVVGKGKEIDDFMVQVPFLGAKRAISSMEPAVRAGAVAALRMFDGYVCKQLRIADEERRAAEERG
jgi:hypothetical protein